MTTAADPVVAALREQITALDRALLAAVNRRLELVGKLHEHKAQKGSPLRRPRARGGARRGAPGARTRGPLSERGRRRARTFVLDLAQAGAPRVSDVIVCLPGDGIGPEVMAQARARARAAAARGRGRGAARSAAPRSTRSATRCPTETLEACRAADAVLLGAVGGPKWDGGAVRPEQGLLGLRRELDVYANLRPALGDDIDLLIVRELVGGLYFGARGVRDDGTVFDTCEYHPGQVERVARRAFELARAPPRPARCRSTRRTCSTPRACGGASSTELAPEYPDVELRHGLVDSVAMQLVTDPETFDVLVTENMFGDILSDVAAAVTGGLGLAASASLGDGGPGIFEPVHGSAPDIAGTGAATRPRCCARSRWLLEHGLGERARGRARRGGRRSARSQPTPDLGGNATTTEFGDAVLAALAKEEAWTTALS